MKAIRNKNLFSHKGGLIITGDDLPSDSVKYRKAYMIASIGVKFDNIPCLGNFELSQDIGNDVENIQEIDFEIRRGRLIIKNIKLRCQNN